MVTRGSCAALMLSRLTFSIFPLLVIPQPAPGYGSYRLALSCSCTHLPEAAFTLGSERKIMVTCPSDSSVADVLKGRTT
jgi:hypothetical protein